MKTTVHLADAAQVDAAGKIHALGLGWTVTVSPTPPAAIVTIVEVEWNETNQRYRIEFALEDQDGHPVMMPGPGGGELAPLTISADYEVGRPAGAVPGSPLTFPLAIPLFPGIPLQPGASYVWRVTNSGQPGESIGARFSVRA